MSWYAIMSVDRKKLGAALKEAWEEYKKWSEAKDGKNNLYSN